MKNKCALLLKIQLLQTLPLNRLRYSHDPKERSRALLMGISVGLVGLVLIFYSLLFAAGCVMAGLAGVIPPLVITASSLLTLATTLIKSNGLLFGFKDYDLLLSLPVRSRDVIASRLIALYLLDLAPTVVFAAPASVVYGMAVGAGIVTWILLFFSLLLAPLLPLVIGAFLSGLIALLTARLRRRSVLTSVLSLAAMMLFMAGAFAIPQMEGADLSALAEQMSAMISRIYPPAALFAQAAEGNVLSFLLLVLVSLGAAALFVLLFAKVFSWLNSALSARRSSGHFRLGAQRAASPLRALYLKELKRFVSCPVYLMNCGVGPSDGGPAGYRFLFPAFRAKGAGRAAAAPGGAAGRRFLRGDGEHHRRRPFAGRAQPLDPLLLSGGHPDHLQCQNRGGAYRFRSCRDSGRPPAGSGPGGRTGGAAVDDGGPRRIRRAIRSGGVGG